jgi:hypothetical protein
MPSQPQQENDSTKVGLERTKKASERFPGLLFITIATLLTLAVSLLPK